MSPARSTARAAKGADAVLVAAVDLARNAILEQSPADQVGEHEGTEADGERVVTHHFTCTARGYSGWRWAVTLARAPRARHATVSEVVLLPGPAAVLAPAWVPWADRIAPGDLGDSDVLPYRPDDPRLEPGFEATDDEDADRVAIWELGLGRARVLSPQGRDEAATRWFEGPNGPSGDSALHAPCLSCGFYLPLAGSMRQVFGVCANEWSPSDGQVVSSHHGCGAHSETDQERAEPESLPDLILDELGPESVALVPRDLTRPGDEEPVAPEVAVADEEPVVVETPVVDAVPVELAPPVETVAPVDPAPTEEPGDT